MAEWLNPQRNGSWSSFHSIFFKFLLSPYWYKQYTLIRGRFSILFFLLVLFLKVRDSELVHLNIYFIKYTFWIDVCLTTMMFNPNLWHTWAVGQHLKYTTVLHLIRNIIFILFLIFTMNFMNSCIKITILFIPDIKHFPSDNWVFYVGYNLLSFTISENPDIILEIIWIQWYKSILNASVLLHIWVIFYEYGFYFKNKNIIFIYKYFLIFWFFD